MLLGHNGPIMANLKLSIFEHTCHFCASTVGGVYQMVFITSTHTQNLQDQIVVLRQHCRSQNRNVFNTIWQKQASKLETSQTVYFEGKEGRIKAVFVLVKNLGSDSCNGDKQQWELTKIAIGSSGIQFNHKWFGIGTQQYSKSLQVIIIQNGENQSELQRTTGQSSKLDRQIATWQMKFNLGQKK